MYPALKQKTRGSEELASQPAQWKQRASGSLRPCIKGTRWSTIERDTKHPPMASAYTRAHTHMNIYIIHLKHTHLQQNTHTELMTKAPKETQLLKQQLSVLLTKFAKTLNAHFKINKRIEQMK